MDSVPKPAGLWIPGREMPRGEPQDEYALLLGSIVMGDHQTYVVLVGRYLDRALRTAERMTGNRDDAEELP